MSLLDDASIIITPNGYKAGKLYAFKPYNGNGDMTWVRGSTATRRNSVGTLESSAIDVPRINFPIGGGCPSILLEPQRTNLYLNSAVLATQNVTTIADSYTVSFYGTGTVTFTGTYAGSLVGTGANDLVSLTFVATAGVLTSTIAGSVLNSNCELGKYPTMHIPTLGATVTRLKDIGSDSGTVSDFDSNKFTLFFECKNHSIFENFNKTICIQGANANDGIFFKFRADLSVIQIIGVANGVLNLNLNFAVDTNTILNFSKYAVTCDNLDVKFYLNGSLMQSDTLSTPFIASSFIKLMLFVGSESFFTETKQIQTYKGALTLSEIESL